MCVCMIKTGNETKSMMMSKIKSKDTDIEIKVRKWLHSQGYRFRKNDARYPGKPDVVLPKHHAVIFVNGCFWHGHDNCKKATIPKTNTEFWLKKINGNKQRDLRNIELLKDGGWNVIVVWECELKKQFEDVMVSVVERLHNS